MSRIKALLIENTFELRFRTKKFTEFQSFFAELMELRHPNDFQRVMPWGRHGDRKNDGYIRSQQQMFQVYGPTEMSSVATIKKIGEDFEGAKSHWKEHLKIWTFVHNSADGLPPDVLQTLLNLRAANMDITIDHWGLTELRTEFLQLSEQDQQRLIGQIPDESDMQHVRMKEVEVVVKRIAAQSPSNRDPIRPVPQDKLTRNYLSPDVEELLRLGMRKSDLVGRFFEQWHDPGLGDRVASEFNARYRDLRDSGVAPDEIYSQLQIFAGGAELRHPTEQMAIYAVVAYLFESCDIYEAGTNER